MTMNIHSPDLRLPAFDEDNKARNINIQCDNLLNTFLYIFPAFKGKVKFYFVNVSPIGKNSLCNISNAIIFKMPLFGKNVIIE